MEKRSAASVYRKSIRMRHHWIEDVNVLFLSTSAMVLNPLEISVWFILTREPRPDNVRPFHNTCTVNTCRHATYQGRTRRRKRPIGCRESRAHPLQRIGAPSRRQPPAVACALEPRVPGTPSHPECASAVFRRGMHLRRGMLPWQGGGHRRRFVRRKEPLKTWDPRRIFFATRLLAGERLETRSAALAAARSEPLKQATISLRPGPYSARGGRWRETVRIL